MTKYRVDYQTFLSDEVHNFAMDVSLEDAQSMLVHLMMNGSAEHPDDIERVIITASYDIE